MCSCFRSTFVSTMRHVFADGSKTGAETAYCLAEMTVPWVVALGSSGWITNYIINTPNL